MSENLSFLILLYVLPLLLRDLPKYSACAGVVQYLPKTRVIQLFFNDYELAILLFVVVFLKLSQIL